MTSCSAARRRGSSWDQAAASRALRRNPLTRALRVDKLTLAALEATLWRSTGNPSAPEREIPVLAMLTAPPARLAATGPTCSPTRLRRVASRCAVTESDGSVGGGAFPAATHARLGARARRRRGGVRTGSSALGTRRSWGASPTGALLLDLRAIPESADARVGDAL